LAGQEILHLYSQEPATGPSPEYVTYGAWIMRITMSVMHCVCTMFSCGCALNLWN